MHSSPIPKAKLDNFSRRIPILTYHSIDDSDSPISIRPEVFSWQIDRLREKGFTGISLAGLKKAIKDKGLLPKQPIVLTFDDGYKNNLEEALPALKRNGFSATIFVVTSHVGGRNDWPSQPSHVPMLPMLDWEEIAHLSDEGMDIGAHTKTHPRLDSLEPSRALEEIQESKLEIESRLGIKASSFAYPYGAINGECQSLVESLFKASCTVEMGFANMAGNWHALSRLDCYYFKRRSIFNLIGSPLGNVYIRIRSAGRHLKRIVRSSDK